MKRNPAYTERQRLMACADYGRLKKGKKTRTGMKRADLRDFCRKPVVPKSQRKGKWMQKVRKYRKTHDKNPHLTSSKWRYVGLFKKGDVKDVKRLLRIHGIASKFTADKTGKMKGKGLKELYVERSAWQTAYAAITRLYEGGQAA